MCRSPADAAWAQGEERESPAGEPETPREACLAQELEQQKTQLAQLCQAVNSICAKLSKLHQETVTCNRAEIARLAIEIARRILPYRAGKGDYNLPGIIEEALKRAPTRQNLVIRLNPDDLPPCQRWQQENPESPLAELELTADGSIGRGECLVETPKGIVKSFIDEHLERISEALQKVP
jgi:flagellar assembly protein FliH